MRPVRVVIYEIYGLLTTKVDIPSRAFRMRSSKRSVRWSEGMSLCARGGAGTRQTMRAFAGLVSVEEFKRRVNAVGSTDRLRHDREFNWSTNRLDTSYPSCHGS